VNEQCHENNNNQLGGFLAGLLVGGLVGAGMMLLLAPQSGKRTRANIQQKSIELRDQMTKTAHTASTQIRKKARQVTDDVQEQAGDLQQRGQDAIDEQRDHLGQSLTDLGKAVHT
jgi:gas vesicle protein